MLFITPSPPQSIPNVSLSSHTDLLGVEPGATWGLLHSLEWGCAGSCPLSGRRNGGLNHRRTIGEPQNRAINKICAATQGGGLQEGILG